jgi:hypothetical protein
MGVFGEFFSQLIFNFRIIRHLYLQGVNHSKAQVRISKYFLSAVLEGLQYSPAKNVNNATEKIKGKYERCLQAIVVPKEKTLHLAPAIIFDGLIH